MEDFDQSIGDMPTMGQSPNGLLAKIDRYELQSELGRGAFGAVFLAKDLVADTLVAIKTLPPEINHSPDELYEVRENFKLVSKLAHPNIAQLKHLHKVENAQPFREGIHISRGDYLVVMEHVEGSTLRNWVTRFRKKKVPFDQMLKILQQVASALDYAHDEDIIHRDIKPANIMITSKQKIKILDFGLAAEVRSSMARISMDTGSSSGTRPYMPPEQLLGKRQNHTCDQYALGVMCYEMLCGEVPFQSVFSTHDMVLIKDVVCRDEPEMIDEISSVQSEVLFKALAKDKDGRYKTCSDFVRAFNTDRDSRDSKPKEKTVPQLEEPKYNYNYLSKISKQQARAGLEIDADLSWTLCHYCGGYGSDIIQGEKISCANCGGEGHVETGGEQKKLRIKVPQNIDSGSRIRLRAAGLNKEDVYVKVIIEDELETLKEEEQKWTSDTQQESSEERTNFFVGEHEFFISEGSASTNICVTKDVLDYGGSIHIPIEGNKFSVEVPEKSLDSEYLAVYNWSKEYPNKLLIRLDTCSEDESPSFECRANRKVSSIEMGRIFVCLSLLIGVIIGVLYKNETITDAGFFFWVSAIIMPFCCQWLIKRFWHSILSLILVVLGNVIGLYGTALFSLADYEIRELVLAGTMGLSALLFIYMIQLFKHCIREPSK